MEYWYIYDGPVKIFGKTVNSNWHGVTIAETEAKAMSNLKYLYRKNTGRAKTIPIGLPGVLRREEVKK